MGFEAVGDGRAFAFDEVEGFVRVEVGREDLSGARHHGHQGRLRVPERVEQRQVAHDRVAFGDRHAEAALLDIADQLVAVQDALGKSRGAGRVHDEDGVVRIHGGGTLGQLGVGHLVCTRQGGPPGSGSGMLARADDHDAPESLERGIPYAVADRGQGDGLAHHAEVVDRPRHVVRDQHRAVGLAQHVLEVLGTEAGVHRHLHGADLRQREHQEDPLRTVVEPQRDVVSPGDAEAHQRLRRTVDLRLELCEGVALSLEDEAPARTEAARHLVGQIAEATLGVPVGHGIFAGRPAHGADVDTDGQSIARAGERTLPFRRVALSLRPVMRTSGPTATATATPPGWAA